MADSQYPADSGRQPPEIEELIDERGRLAVASGPQAGPAFAAVRGRLRQRRQAWARRGLTGGRLTQARPSPGSAFTPLTTGAPPAAFTANALAVRPESSTTRPRRWSMDIGVIERERILRGWSQRQLAQAAHVDAGTLGDLLARRRRPMLGTVQAICASLGLSLADVISFDREGPAEAQSAG